MNCRKCGNVINENDSFCRVCGTVVNNNPSLNEVNPSLNPTPNVEPVLEQQVQGINPVEGVSPIPPQEPTPMPTQNQVEQPTFTNQVNSQYMKEPTPAPTPMSNQGYNALPEQTPIAQPNYNVPNQTQLPQGNNDKKFQIIIVIMVIIIIGLGGFIGYKMLNDNNAKQQETNNKKNETNQNNNKEENKDNDKEKEDTNIIAENATFEASGYKFIIPKELKYQIESTVLTFSDSTTFQANMTADFMPYSDIRIDQTEIIAELESSGIKVVGKAERSINNKNFYLIQINYNNQDGIFYFSQIDEYYSVVGVIYGRTTAAYEKALGFIGTMVTSATKTSSFAPGEDKPSESKLSVDKNRFENNDIEGIVYPLN